MAEQVATITMVRRSCGDLWEETLTKAAGKAGGLNGKKKRLIQKG